MSNPRTWRDYLGTALELSTVHGLARVHYHKHLLVRLPLLVYILTCLTLCSITMFNTIQSFLSYDTVTSYQIIPESYPEFPVVAFCNLNPMDQNFAGPIVSKYVNDGTVKRSYYDTESEYVVELSKYVRANLIKEFSSEPLSLAKIGFYIQQVLVSCRFKDQVCDSTDFMPTLDYYYGLCYRFNQGKLFNGTNRKIIHSGEPGWLYGLQLELYAGSDSGVIQEEYVPDRGFRILVFNRTHPYQVAQDWGVNVATGQETNIAVSRHHLYRLGPPYSDCIDPETENMDWKMNDVIHFMYTDFILNNYYDNGQWTMSIKSGYSQYVCLKMCFQMFVRKNCSCVDITLPKSQNLSSYYSKHACSSHSQMNCLTAAQRYFYASGYEMQTCYSKCPMECFTISYELKMSVATYPTRWYANLLANGSNFNRIINTGMADANKSFINYTNRYEDLKSSVSKVNVFYENTLYHLSEQTPAMDSTTLLTSLGGSLGASLVTLTEPLSIGISILIEKIEAFCQKRRVKSSDNIIKQVKPATNP